MLRPALILVGAAGMAIVSACAVQPGPPAAAARTNGRECFLARQVNGYAPVSDEVLDVQVGANRYFRLTVDGSCPQSSFSQRLVLRTMGGGDWICQGLDAEIIVPFSAGAPQRCLVNNVQPIDKATWLADRRH